MTNAERQARHRAARAAALPMIHYRRAADRAGRSDLRGADRLLERDYTACRCQQPSTRLYGQPPPEEGDSKTAAQRSGRRRDEISDRRVPTGREVLEVFQDASVHPKAADDLHTASACAVACHRDRSRPGVGDEMLKSAGEPGSHHLLRRQQRQDSEENDAAPGEDAKRCHKRADARWTYNPQ